MREVAEFLKSIMWPLASIAICVAGLMFASTVQCGVSRSALVEDPTYPKICKMELECLYLLQDSEVKSSCVTEHAIPCAKMLTFETCKSEYPKDREKRLACRLGLK